MRHSPNHLAILVGASPACDDLRREFVRRARPHAGLARGIADLRRLLHRVAPDRSVLCVSVDAATLARHADDLRILLRDARSFPGIVRSLGIVAEPEQWANSAGLGFDLHATSVDDAARILDVLTETARRSARGTVRFADFDLPVDRSRLGLRSHRRLVVPPDLATDLEDPELP